MLVVRRRTRRLVQCMIAAGADHHPASARVRVTLVLDNSYPLKRRARHVMIAITMAISFIIS